MDKEELTLDVAQRLHATAKIIRELHVSPEQRAEIVSRFVTMFADGNARFQPSKFQTACEPEQVESVRVAA